MSSPMHVLHSLAARWSPYIYGKIFPFAGLMTLIDTLLTLFIFTDKLARRIPLLVATVAALAIAKCMHANDDDDPKMSKHTVMNACMPTTVTTPS